PDGFFLIVLHLSDPGHAVTAALDDHAAHGLKELVLARGANQGLISFGHGPEDTAEPVGFLLGLPALGDVIEAGGEHGFFAGAGGEEASLRHEGLLAGAESFDFETLFRYGLTS